MPDVQDPRYQAFLAASGLQPRPALTPGADGARGRKRRGADSPEPESQIQAGRKLQALAERMAGGLGLPGDSQETPTLGLGGLGTFLSMTTNVRE